MAQHGPLTNEQVIAFVTDSITAAYELGSQGDNDELAIVITSTADTLRDRLDG